MLTLLIFQFAQQTANFNVAVDTQKFYGKCGDHLFGIFIKKRKKYGKCCP